MSNYVYTENFSQKFTNGIFLNNEEKKSIENCRKLHVIVIEVWPPSVVTSHVTISFPLALSLSLSRCLFVAFSFLPPN